MIIKNDVRYMGVWYSIDFGYYTFYDNKWCYDEFYPNIKLQVPHDVKRKYCILYPSTPYYDNKIFSRGDLR